MCEDPLNQMELGAFGLFVSVFGVGVNVCVLSKSAIRGSAVLCEMAVRPVKPRCQQISTQRRLNARSAQRLTSSRTLTSPHSHIASHPFVPSLCFVYFLFCCSETTGETFFNEQMCHQAWNFHCILNFFFISTHKQLYQIQILEYVLFLQTYKMFWILKLFCPCVNLRVESQIF